MVTGNFEFSYPNQLNRLSLAGPVPEDDASPIEGFLVILVGFRSIWPAVNNLSGRTAYAPGGMTAGVYIEDGQVFYKLLRTPLQLRSGVFLCRRNHTAKTDSQS